LGFSVSACTFCGNRTSSNFDVNVAFETVFISKLCICFGIDTLDFVIGYNPCDCTSWLKSLDIEC